MENILSTIIDFISMLVGLLFAFWWVILIILVIFGGAFLSEMEFNNLNKERVEQGLSEYTYEQFTEKKQEESDKQAFEELNDLRVSYGLQKLVWSNNIYELVKHQASKNLCNSSNCSHQDSDGKYFDYYATKFGVSLNGGSGENIAGSSCMRAIDLWLNSKTGHKEIMLDSSFRKGALAFDKENCVFIGTG
ncbi:MAG: CAP domain-containing protein [Candidatus Iainarchaeum sp.]